MKAVRVRRAAGVGAQKNFSEDGSAKQVRLTVYTTDEVDFAIRYLALKKRKSVNELVNETFHALLDSSGINPSTLPQNLP